MQVIKNDGARFLMNVPLFDSDEGITIREWKNGTKMLILPLSPQLKEVLDKISTIAFEKTIIPNGVDGSPERKFKPLYLDDSLFLPCSKWCKFYKLVDSVNPYTVIKEEELGKGEYSVTLEVSHIYIGPHRKGANCSLSLRALCVVYKEHAVIDPSVSKPDADDNSWNELLGLFKDNENKPKQRRRKKKCAGDSSPAVRQKLM